MPLTDQWDRSVCVCVSLGFRAVVQAQPCSFSFMPLHFPGVFYLYSWVSLKQICTQSIVHSQEQEDLCSLNCSPVPQLTHRLSEQEGAIVFQATELYGTCYVAVVK